MVSNKLKCCLLNARSLNSKVAEFRLFLAAEVYDIVFVVETWFNSTMTDSMLVYNLPYNIIRRDRGSNGGGLAVFLKHGVCCSILESSPNLEAISTN